MIYLDHAATSPTSRPVLEAMWPYMTEVFANPSSAHGAGRAASEALETARSTIAQVLEARPGEITFTSGGTESNNLAIKGIALARPRGRHIVTSVVEHKSVLETCSALLADFGFEITVVPVDTFGRVSPDDVAGALRPDTTLCTVMYANNDVGTVQPIADIADVCRAMGVPFHTDAVQAAGLLPLNVDILGADALTLSAHKFGGPKGMGALYVRSGIPVHPLLDGGGQERGLRSGTSNVAGAVGMAAALQSVEDQQLVEVQRLTALRNTLVESVLIDVPGAMLTGHPSARLANSASFCFEDVGGDAVLQELELREIYCSSGSACSAGSDDASHVLLAMGIPLDLARTAVRLTLGASTTAEQIDAVAVAIRESVTAVRSLAN